MRAARVDQNHVEIVKALRDYGAMVWSLASVGRGIPDLLVTFKNTTILMEVKDGKKSPSQRNLTKDQLKFHAEWTGGILCIVTDVEGALRVLKQL